MNTQNYEKNTASYCNVVNAGRVARRLELLAIDFDRLIDRLAIVVGESQLPKNLPSLKSQIWSLQFKAEKKYRELFDEHFRMLEGE